MPLSDNVYGKSIKEQGRTSAGGNSFSWDFLLKLYKTAIIDRINLVKWDSMLKSSY